MPAIGTGIPGLLEGRRVLVTGGASGIGAQVVATFAAMGATGVVLDLPAAVAGATAGGWPALLRRCHRRGLAGRGDRRGP